MASVSGNNSLGPQPRPAEDEPADPTAAVTESDSEEGETYGPVLPPGFKTRKEQEQKTKTVGPTLPEGFKGRPQELAAKYGISLNSDSDTVTSIETDEDGCAIGPQPPSGGANLQEYVSDEFEKRSQAMKDRLDGKEIPEEPKRESWMLELPDAHRKEFGLGPRTFRRKEAPERGDGSLWTDTPADRERKSQEDQGGEQASGDARSLTSARDEKLGALAQELQKGRKESLVNIHRKQLKRKQKEDQGKLAERRSFDRDLDLQVNRFDQAQKEAVMKKARHLNDRFSSGQAKYL